MPEVCKEAEWLAAALMISDPAFAREMTSLIAAKNNIESQIAMGLKNKELYEHLHTYNERIKLFLEAKLLS
jgi:hypothetical protein